MVDYRLCSGHGWGVEKDLVSALRYRKMAADLGCARTMILSGIRLASSDGVQRDAASVERYLRMAADCLWAFAAPLMAGDGVAKDEAELMRSFSSGCFDRFFSGERCLENGLVCASQAQAWAMSSAWAISLFAT
jgi:TPR repeat protein